MSQQRTDEEISNYILLQKVSELLNIQIQLRRHKDYDKDKTRNYHIINHIKARKNFLHYGNHFPPSQKATPTPLEKKYKLEK